MKVGSLVATMDNAAAIGEKPQDIVSASDQLTAYMTARVSFLEQLAAQALPIQILLANFSGDAAWSRYEKGIQQVFEEAGLTCPAIAGSTESNMPTLQSGLAITMLGRANSAVHLTMNSLAGTPMACHLWARKCWRSLKMLHSCSQFFRHGERKWFSKYGPLDQRGCKENSPVYLGGSVLKVLLIVQNPQGPARSFC